MTCGLPYQLLAGDIGDIAMSRVSRGAPIHQLTEAIVGIELALGRKRSMAFSIGSGIVLVFFKKISCVFLNLLFCPFSLQIAAFWSRKLPFQRYCNILEFEPLSFHGIVQHLDGQAFHVGWYFATRSYSGFV